MLQRSPHRDCGYDNTGVGTHCIEISGEHMWWNSLDQSSARSNYLRLPQTLCFYTPLDKKDPLNEKMSVILIFFFFFFERLLFKSSINEITASVSNFIY